VPSLAPAPTTQQQALAAPSHNFRLAPTAVWELEWRQSTPNAGLYEIEYLPSSAYVAATAGSTTRSLSLRGRSVAELSLRFDEVLGRCAESGDYTEILSRHRHFV
jgi:hypothetical protein